MRSQNNVNNQKEQDPEETAHLREAEVEKKKKKKHEIFVFLNEFLEEEVLENRLKMKS